MRYLILPPISPGKSFMGASQNEIKNSGIMQGTTQGNHNIVLNIFVVGKANWPVVQTWWIMKTCSNKGRSFRAKLVIRYSLSYSGYRGSGHEGGKSVYSPIAPLLEPPLLVEHHSRREETVRTFRQLVARHTWIALYGGASAGNTPDSFTGAGIRCRLYMDTPRGKTNV